MNAFVVEICCGSYYDGLQAEAGGATRIELNSALHLGGLTPSLAELLLLKKYTNLKVIAMVRPRAAGFCYHAQDFETMLTDCELLLKYGADGIAFGCLHTDSTLHLEQTKQIVDLVKSHQKEVVFHRAFDCVADPDNSIQQLIHLGVDRLLTSGLKEKAWDGRAMLARLQQTYKENIEILAGSGINAANACDLIKQTGIRQIHSSCKAWLPDPTTTGKEVSYAYCTDDASLYGGKRYEVVSADLVEKLINSIQ